MTRFRAVPAAGYATAVCVLWILTFIMGAWIYTKYRIYVRIPIEQAGYWKTQGFFELKEHVATLGLGLLPIYWYIWKNVHDPEYRQRAQIDRPRCSPSSVGSISSSATSSTMSGGSDHEHHHGNTIDVHVIAEGKSRDIVAGGVHQVQDVRRRVRNFGSGHVFALRMVQPAAVHLSSGHESRGVLVGAGKER